MMDSPRTDAQSLPASIEALRALVLTTMSERDALALERDTLQTQNDRLRHLLLQLRRMHFGPRSERLPEEQLQLAFEAIEQAIAVFLLQLANLRAHGGLRSEHLFARAGKASLLGHFQKRNELVEIH